MVISFSEKISIHHDNFIVTTSIPFFFRRQIDRSARSRIVKLFNFKIETHANVSKFHQATFVPRSERRHSRKGFSLIKPRERERESRIEWMEEDGE